MIKKFNKIYPKTFGDVEKGDLIYFEGGRNAYVVGIDKVTIRPICIITISGTGTLNNKRNRLCVLENYERLLDIHGNVKMSTDPFSFKKI